MAHWIKTEDRLPTTFERGSWDGKRSDEVFVKDSNGNYHVARLYDFEYEDTEWYDNDDNTIRYPIIEWMEIPIY